VVDPASYLAFGLQEKGRELLTQDQVDVIFGSWTSVSRKNRFTCIEEVNGLMSTSSIRRGKSRLKTCSTQAAAAKPTSHSCSGLLDEMIWV